MSRTLKLILTIVGISVLIQSCSLYQDNTETIIQNVSIAQKAPDTDFSKFKTFTVTDSILYIDNEDKYRASNHFVETILANISDNFTSLGYTMATNPEEADLLVDLTYILSATTVYYDPYYYWGWDYWWWWDGYFPYPYYPYYPYPLPVEYISYYTGNLIIETVDMTHNGERFPIVWHALVRSLISGSNSKEEISSAIDECFTILPPKN
mgnify:CR=1 FL=1